LSSFYIKEKKKSFIFSHAETKKSVKHSLCAIPDLSSILFRHVSGVGKCLLHPHEMRFALVY
jgi:hypothetical protein